MNSTRPYLIRAFYDWIIDNDCTPYLVVNAGLPGVQVPNQHVDKGQIVLNVSVTAVQALMLENSSISFTARFSGVAYDIFIPINAVMAIYAKENGRGMIFSDEEDGLPPEPPSDGGGDTSSSKGKGSGKKGSGHLKVVK